MLKLSKKIIIIGLSAGLFWSLTAENAGNKLSNQSQIQSATCSRISPIPGVKRIPAAIPEGFKELPYIESSKLPEFLPVENSRGFMFFNRSITQAVYRNSIPLESERISSVAAFATPGEIEPLTFSIYPLRDIQNMKINVSELRCGNKVIPLENLDLRLVTEWPIRYPMYNTKNTFRWLPELLEQVTSNSFKRGECQRYWLKVKVPVDARQGLYTGCLSITDNAGEKRTQLPIGFRVLGYALQSDPAKRYSAYFHLNKNVFYGTTGETLNKFMRNEFIAMQEYGLNLFPVIPLSSEHGKGKDLEISIRWPGLQAVDMMIKMGFKGPIPIEGGIVGFYKKHVPNGKINGHWIVSKLPENDEMFNEIERAFRKFRLECEAKKWPELICCPLDEVDASCATFSAKIYAAIRRAGIKTYITKDPTALDAAEYRKYDAIDVWCSQPFSMSYNQVTSE
ncbi:MAG: hypothetical protein WCI51_14630 [Lentisphaerota bacterium]